MQTLKGFLCLLIFSFGISAQQDSVVPIATTYYLLGGSKDGKWLTTEQVVPSMAKQTKMILVSVNGVTQDDAVLNDMGENYGACEDIRVFHLEPESESGFAVGANATWNLVPRIPKSIAVTNKNYRQIAAAFLKTKGITRSKIKLNQIIQVDLEGDGQNETLIVGNLYKRGMDQDQVAGDYSFVLLRKTVKGKPQNLLISGEFFPRNRDGNYELPTDRKILAIADLNGDGRMEIVLSLSYYEGNAKQVFEIKNGKAVKVLETECSV